MGTKKYYNDNGDLKNVYSIAMHIDANFCDYEQYKKYATDSYYFHSFFEVMLVKSNNIRMYINDKSYILNRNDLLIFNPQDFHRYILEQGQVYHRISCEFSHEYIRDFSTHNSDLLACFTKRSPDFCPIRHLDDTDTDILTKLMETAIQTHKTSKYGDDVIAKCAIGRMLIFINQIYKNTPNINQGEMLVEYNKMKPIVNYINTHLNEDLALDNLIKKFYISKFHLCRVFKQTLGCTVNEYITYRRVLSAATLLRDGCTVMQACEQVTPDGMSHFISVFKKILGTTPKQYAKRHQT